jgi:hypothetical protein
VNLGFTLPEIRRLDRLPTDALALFLHQDEVPLPDVRGLVDWRLCGELSRLLRAGRLSGAAGETLLMPVRHRFPFERLLVFGLGPSRPLDSETLYLETRRALSTLARIRAHSVALVLPGRPFAGADPELAAQALLRAGAEVAGIDEIILIETLQGRNAMAPIFDARPAA